MTILFSVLRPLSWVEKMINKKFLNAKSYPGNENIHFYNNYLIFLR